MKPYSFGLKRSIIILSLIIGSKGASLNPDSKIFTIEATQKDAEPKPSSQNHESKSSSWASSLNLDKDNFCQNFKVKGGGISFNEETKCEINPDALTTLLSVQVIFRHGMRTPLSKYIGDSYQNFDYGVNGNALGQLTPLGKQWSYKLGEYIRCRYNGFLGTSYSSSESYCQTSETERTMMTAASVLASLWPPTSKDLNSHVDFPRLQWQPIPCTTIPSSVDNKINIWESCPRYSALFAQHKKELTENLSNEEKELFNQVANASGTSIQSYADIGFIYDNIGIQHCQFDLPFPPWFLQLENKMRHFYEINFYEHCGTEELKPFVIGTLFQRFSDNFDNNIGIPLDENTFSAKHKAKMYLFSGHDTTISPILYTLGVYNVSEPPPYNAAVFLELHKSLSNLTPTQYYIKLFYRSQFLQPIKELLIPDCNPCTYDAFKTLIAKYKMNETQWQAECGLTSPQ